MPWKKKSPPAVPVRRGKVMQMFKAAMDECDAVDRDDGAAFKKAQAAHGNAERGSTPAERKAVQDALGRHGYPNGTMPL